MAQPSRRPVCLFFDSMWYNYPVILWNPLIHKVNPPRCRFMDSGGFVFSGILHDFSSSRPWGHGLAIEAAGYHHLLTGPFVVFSYCGRSATPAANPVRGCSCTLGHPFSGSQLNRPPILAPTRHIDHDFRVQIRHIRQRSQSFLDRAKPHRPPLIGN
jgi:hypothetical protein